MLTPPTGCLGLGKILVRSLLQNRLHLLSSLPSSFVQPCLLCLLCSMFQLGLKFSLVSSGTNFSYRFVILSAFSFSRCTRGC